jgi:hypothetical protein
VRARLAVVPVGSLVPGVLGTERSHDVFGRVVEVVVDHDLPLQPPTLSRQRDGPDRHQLGHRLAGPANHDLLALLDPGDQPGKLRLRVVDVVDRRFVNLDLSGLTHRPCINLSRF